MKKPYLKPWVQGDTYQWDITCCGIARYSARDCYVCEKPFPEKLVQKRNFLNGMINLDRGKEVEFFSNPVED